MNTRNAILFILFLFSQYSIAAQQEKIAFRGKEYNKFPFRVDPEKNGDIPPALGNLPDGDYYALNTTKTYRFKSGKKFISATDSTSIGAIFTLKNNRPNGMAEFFYYNGARSAYGNYSDGLQEGEWEFYTIKSGITNYTGGFGLDTGSVQLYYLEQKINFHAGLKEGKYTLYSPSGKITYTGHYHANFETGASKHFYESGLVSRQYYIDKNYNFQENKYSLQLNMVIEKLTADFGNFPATEIVRFSKKIHGPYKEFYPDGTPRVFATAEKGFVALLDTIFHPDGKLALIGTRDKNKDKTVTNYRYFSPEGAKAIISCTDLDILYYLHLDTDGDTVSFELVPEYNSGNNGTELLVSKMNSGKRVLRYYHPATEKQIQINYYPNGNPVNAARIERIDSISDIFLLCKKVIADDGKCAMEKVSVLKKDKDIPRRFLDFAGDLPPVIFYDGKPYSGKARIYPEYRKTEDLSYTVAGNRLDITDYSVKGDRTMDYIEGEVKDGFFEGEWIAYKDWYYDHTKKPHIVLKANFSKGRLYGERTEYVKRKRWRFFWKRGYSGTCGIRCKFDYYITSVDRFQNGWKNGKCQKFSGSGTVTKEINYRNGLKYGDYLFYVRETGGKTEVCSGKFINDLPDGKFVIVENDYDPTTYFIEFSNGVLNGEFKMFRYDKLIEEGRFKNGFKTGIWKNYISKGNKYFLSDEQLYIEADSVSINADLEPVLFNEKDKVSFAVSHRDLRKKQISFYREHRRYYSNGQLALKGNCRYGDSFEDSITIFSPEGKIYFRGEFKYTYYTVKGLESQGSMYFGGTFTSYYPDGTIKGNGYTYNNYLSRENCEFDCKLPDPDLFYLNYYDESGKPVLSRGTGWLLAKNENGVRVHEGELAKMNRIGTWKFYSESGNLSEIGNYENGKREGFWLQGDLTGLHLGDKMCFDLSDPGVVRYLKENEKKLDLKVSYYEKGELLYTKTYKVFVES